MIKDEETQELDWEKLQADAGTEPEQEQALIDFLQSETLRDLAMSMSMLDGFITAIVIGPTEIPVEEWFPQIFGGVRPEFRDERQRLRVSLAIAKRVQETETTFQNHPSEWEPWLIDHEDPAARAEEWAAGFQLGVNLGDEGWQDIVKNKYVGAAFLAVLGLVGPDEEDEVADAELGITAADRAQMADIFERRAETIEQLPEFVSLLYEFWHGQIRRPVRKIKIGRNEPCPCGSGKKYKRCCGA